MTNANRRQLARVRNAFLGATALAGFAAVATPASAIVINDAYTPAQAVDTTNITGVGQMVIDEQNGFIGLCTVSLINPRTVIFASHCVNENPAGNGFEPATGYGSANGGLPIGFFFNANNNVAGNSAIGHWLNGVAGGPAYQTRTAEYAYNSNFVVYNTNCCTIGLGNNFLQSDVAMAALDTPAVGIPTYTLLFTALSAPAHATITGYGGNGIGTTGSDGSNIDFKRRVAENIVSVLGSLDDQDTFLFGGPDGLPANLYMADFNDPKFNTAEANQFDFNIFHDVALPREGITAPGDSGGPLIIDHEFSAPTIAAVLSGGDRFYNAQPGASYGTTSFYQPLYLYWDWILANNPYKYVNSTAGNHNWRDADTFVMGLDPAYVTIGANNTLVNALPTTKAQGQADVPPGFGQVCYFDDCVDITTGEETYPTPPATPGPTTAHVSGSRPFGGLLGQAGFVSLAQSYVAAKNAGLSGGGPLNVEASTIDNSATTGAAAADGSLLASDPATADGSILSPSAPPPGGPGTPSAQSDWINPEGFAQVGSEEDGESVQGAPGASPGQVVQDTEANVATLTPARYYDVTIGAAGTITLDTGSITIDRLTVFGANAGLTIATGASLRTLINTNSFAGTTTVNGTLTSTGSVSMFGGILSGTGSVTAPSVDFLMGAIAPGTNGTVGTLTINGGLNLGAGSTTLIDLDGTTSDVIQVNGAAVVGGTVLFNSLSAPQQGSSYAFLKATGGITGAYDSVPDSIAGVLYPVVTKTTVGGVQQEVVTLMAGTFANQLGGTGTTDQNQIAAGLDAARGAHYNDMIGLYQAIDPLSGATLRQALENLAPDAERATPLVAEMQQTGYSNIVTQHLTGMGGASGGAGIAFNVDTDGLKSALNSATGTSSASQQLMTLGAGIATNPGGGNNAISTTGVPAAPADASDTLAFLPAGAGGFLAGSSLNGSVNIGGGGGKATVRGLVIGAGIDLPVDENLVVGGAFGYSDATTTLRSAPSQVQSDQIVASIYARYDFGDNYIAQAYGTYGRQTIETRRLVVVGLSTFSLQGHSSGDTPSIGASIGRLIEAGRGFNIIPSASIAYTSNNIDAFSETGGAPAMSFADFNQHSTIAKLGFDANLTFDVWGVHVTPNTHLFWVDNLGHNGSIQSSFAAGPASIMTFGLTPRSDTYGEAGFGADFDLGDVVGTQALLSGRYDTTLGRDDIKYGAWTGRLSIKF